MGVKAVSLPPNTKEKTVTEGRPTRTSGRPFRG